MWHVTNYAQQEETYGKIITDSSGPIQLFIIIFIIIIIWSVGSIQSLEAIAW